MADPIDEAEHFTAEAIRHGVEVARQAQQVLAEHRRADLNRRFAYHPASTDAVREAHEKNRDMALAYGLWLLETMPWCPELEKALDALDLACMHGNAGIARNQLGDPPPPPRLEIDSPSE